jgi:hypothetical protein
MGMNEGVAKERARLERERLMREAAQRAAQPKPTPPEEIAAVRALGTKFVTWATRNNISTDYEHREGHGPFEMFGRKTTRGWVIHTKIIPNPWATSDSPYGSDTYEQFIVTTEGFICYPQYRVGGMVWVECVHAANVYMWIRDYLAPRDYEVLWPE